VKNATITVIAIALFIGVSAAGAAKPDEDLPKVLTLGSMANVYEPVRFNHAEHVSMAGGCADCHHQHGKVQVSSCTECHKFDPSDFRKNVIAAKIKPCGSCHTPVERPGSVGLKTAYHLACFKCHKTDVGGGVKNLAGCTEMCHALKAKEKREEKK
jgi:predicted CXXCH cytochrome family protein